jgi:hemerythrin-like metal-binding protein
MTIKIAQWRSQYETGDPLVDSQHQSIFSAINALSTAMMEGQGEELLQDTLNILREYTELHFECEEKFMLSHQYPGYADHQLKHQRFKERVAQLTAKGAQDIKELTIEVSHLLTDWFIHHIRDEDQKMIDFCTGRGDRAPTVFSKEDNPSGMEDMVLAQWHTRYDTGYTLIDDQHKSLFHAINALHNAMLRGQAEELLQRTLKTLHHYTTIHFETEEQFMLKTHYFDYEDHRQKHQMLRAKVQEFLAAENADDPKKLTIEVSHFLTHWLISHINTEDQKMITFLREERAARLGSTLESY